MCLHGFAFFFFNPLREKTQHTHTYTYITVFLPFEKPNNNNLITTRNLLQVIKINVGSCFERC